MKAIAISSVIGVLVLSFASGLAADEQAAPVRRAFTENVSASFDLQEKVTINLKDAKLSDVVRTLGALAKLPVYVDPDVEGKVTVMVEDMPYEKVLDLISKMQGISIRIDQGILVASRSSSSLLPALTLPEKFQGLPSMPVEEYSKSFATLPLSLLIRWNGTETCRRLVFEQASPPTVSMALSGDDPSARITVTQFGYEPVTRTRFLALETPFFRTVHEFLPTTGFTVQKKIEPADLTLTIFPQKPEMDSCPELERWIPSGSDAVSLYLLIRESGPDGHVRSAPKVEVRPGQSFTARSGLRDEVSGQHRDFAVYGYVSRDGKSVAAALVATAIWVDPKGGRRYVFAQVADVGRDFFALRREGTVVATLPAGVATNRPLEVAISLSPEGLGATD